jgi:hypothetical protein
VVYCVVCAGDGYVVDDMQVDRLDGCDMVIVRMCV